MGVPTWRQKNEDRVAGSWPAPLSARVSLASTHVPRPGQFPIGREFPNLHYHPELVLNVFLLDNFLCTSGPRRAVKGVKSERRGTKGKGALGSPEGFKEEVNPELQRLPLTPRSSETLR